MYLCRSHSSSHHFFFVYERRRDSEECHVMTRQSGRRHHIQENRYTNEEIFFFLPSLYLCVIQKQRRRRRTIVLVGGMKTRCKRKRGERRKQVLSIYEFISTFQSTASEENTTYLIPFAQIERARKNSFLSSFYKSKRRRRLSQLRKIVPSVSRSNTSPSRQKFDDQTWSLSLDIFKKQKRPLSNKQTKVCRLQNRRSEEKPLNQCVFASVTFGSF